MKTIILSAFILLSGSTSFAQRSLEKLWESDSLTLKGPESALFDPKSNSLYVSSMNSGSIIRLGLDGRLIRKDWVSGLNSNKGSALYKNLLYTAETSAVAVIDVKKASIIKRIPIKGAVMLNDLAKDSNGIVYVSDTQTGKVYR